MTSRTRTVIMQWIMAFLTSLLFSMTTQAATMPINPEQCPYPVINLPESPECNDILRWAFMWERETWSRIAPNDPISPSALNRPATPGGEPYWPALLSLDPINGLIKRMEDMLERMTGKGVDVSVERVALTVLKERALTHSPQNPDPASLETLYFEIRIAKRQLMLRDPDLEVLTKLLFVKRFPLEPSHNYSDHMDSNFTGGGAICALDIPYVNGVLAPELAKTTVLFDAGDGIPRDPAVDYEARKIYFANRPFGPKGSVYWNLMSMNTDGSELRQITSGPFHDYYPCSLPDGGLSFVSTRVNCRFLCFIPLAFTLFRMNADGGDIQPLSHANLTEWGPSIMIDGRILWTRSEYQDKGANFGHTLWATRPDGSYPELVYGNDTLNCMMNGREMPDTGEIACTMISHFGDFNGPIALVNPAEGRFNKDALTNITPDVAYGYDCRWYEFGNKYLNYPDRRCFRDPYPISSDYLLVSHSPSGDWNSPSHLFGLYVIDRYGNRELLYLDPAIGSMCPTPLRPALRPPIVASILTKANREVNTASESPMGEFILSDVYQGLAPSIERGSIKWLRVCEELKSMAESLNGGTTREEYANFTMHYASPIFTLTKKDNGDDKDVTGPSGWTTYVAKGVEGLVPVEDDGSARFQAPAGKVLYFQALDEDLNEVQRMRSVVQLQPGEIRSCIGCHEDRQTVPANKQLKAMARPGLPPQPPPWGKGPFDYQKVVQPVFDKNCISCHDSGHEKGIDLTGTLDANKVPNSYRSLITKGLVSYYDCGWGVAHDKTIPMTAGVVKSQLIDVLNNGHNKVSLASDEMHAIKCWIDLNCPLWPDYLERALREEN